MKKDPYASLFEKSVDTLFDASKPMESLGAARDLLHEWRNAVGFGPPDIKKKAAPQYIRQSIQTLNFVTACGNAAVDTDDFETIRTLMHMVIHDRTRHGYLNHAREKWKALPGPAQTPFKINKEHAAFLLRFKEAALQKGDLDTAIDCNLYHWEMNINAQKDCSAQSMFQKQCILDALRSGKYHETYKHCIDYLRLSRPLNTEQAEDVFHGEYFFYAQCAMRQAYEAKDYSTTVAFLYALRFHAYEQEDIDLLHRCKRNVHEDEDVLKCCHILFQLYDEGRLACDTGGIVRNRLFKECRMIGMRAVLAEDHSLAAWSLRLQQQYLKALIPAAKAVDPSEAKALAREADLTKAQLQAVQVHDTLFLERWRKKLAMRGNIFNDNDPGDIDDEDYLNDIPWNWLPGNKGPDNSGMYTGGAGGKPHRPLPPAHAALSKPRPA